MARRISRQHNVFSESPIDRVPARAREVERKDRSIRAQVRAQVRAAVEGPKWVRTLLWVAVVAGALCIGALSGAAAVLSR